MKPTLRWFCAGVLVAVSLWVSSAHASSGGLLFESSPQLKSCISDGGTSRGSCGWEEVCVVEMEAAMRAMEPYINRWHISDDGNMVWKGDDVNGAEFTTPFYFSTDHDNPAMTRFFQDREAEQTKAFEQWATVKHDCWSKP